MIGREFACAVGWDGTQISVLSRSLSELRADCRAVEFEASRRRLWEEIKLKTSYELVLKRWGGAGKIKNFDRLREKKSSEPINARTSSVYGSSFDGKLTFP